MIILKSRSSLKENSNIIHDALAFQYNLNMIILGLSQNFIECNVKSRASVFQFNILMFSDLH